MSSIPARQMPEVACANTSHFLLQSQYCNAAVILLCKAHSAVRGETSCYQHGMEAITMKRQLSSTAMGLVLPTAALAFATVGDLPSSHSCETAPVNVAEVKNALPNRIHCYIGMSGAPGSVYRGWICEREHAPTLAN
ncbi:MAG: hypothetical protein ACREDD_05610 [Methylocella sp.]